MDIIKVEDGAGVGTEPTASPGESRATNVKMEDAPEPFTFVAVKQEVEESWDEYEVKEEFKNEDTVDKPDIGPEGVSHVAMIQEDDDAGGSSMQLVKTRFTLPNNSGFLSNILISEYRRNMKTGVKLYKYLISDKGEKRYFCELCGRTYLRIGDLIKHGRTHSGERPYSCDICKKSFSKKDVLREHYRTHSGVKPYKCDLCNKCFTKSGNLAIHRLIHTGEKTYACDVCNKKFLLKGVLKLHYRIHTGEKPYRCDICNKAFSRSGHLASHQQTHNKEKQYICKVCNKEFSQKHNLQRHSRTHIVHESQSSVT
jgi:uncharacterized Zn-finger protein